MATLLEVIFVLNEHKIYVVYKLIIIRSLEVFGTFITTIYMPHA